MRVVRGLVLWLGISGLIVWQLHKSGQVPKDEVQTMVVGSLTLGAFAAGLVWAAFTALVRKRSR